MPIVTIPVLVYVASFRQDTLYRASADVLVNRQEAATTSLIGQTPALEDPGRTMDTQAWLARVPLVAERTLAATGLEGASTRVLLDHSSVYPLGDILRFDVSDKDAAQAARFASQYAREFVRYRRELDTTGLEATLAQVRRQLGRLEAADRVSSPLYLRLADREQQLELLKALRTSNISVVRTAAAGDAEQVAPRPKRNAAVGLMAGLVVALVAVFLWETLGTRPRSDLEFEELLGLPLLGRMKLGMAGGTPPIRGAEADAVHGLRTSLELANAGVDARTIMVTSAHEGEGRSAVALQLGLALARGGRRAVLVDLDLRQSALTRLVGLGTSLGVSNVVLGECGLADALVAVPVDDVRTGSGDQLEFVGSGVSPVHPAELLSSSALAEVVGELRQRADVVLLDVPALLDAPDAAAVAPRLDGLLLVVSSRGAHGPVLADVRRALESWPLVKLGFALTDGDVDRPSRDRRPRAEQSTRAQVGETEPAS